MANGIRSLEELKAKIQKAVNITLDTKVADEVKDMLIKNANKLVYGEYNPHVYDHEIGSRRFSLRNPENYEVDKSTTMKIGITPIAEFNPTIWRYTRSHHRGGAKKWYKLSSQNSGDELAGLINYGDGWNGYHYDFCDDNEDEDDLNPTSSYNYTKPRPFIDDTKEQLEEEHTLAVLVYEGLWEAGLHVDMK